MICFPCVAAWAATCRWRAGVVALAAAWLLGVPEQAEAAWAEHRIIAGPEVPFERPITVKVSEDGRSVRVFLPAEPRNLQQGYFIVRAKVRLPMESLEFRLSMSRWFRTSDLEQKRKSEKDPYSSWRGSFKPLLADLDRFREIARLVPETRDWVEGVYLEISLEDAMRTYIVHDFLPEGGCGVMDGGNWDTYDLPAIVEAVLEAKE